MKHSLYLHIPFCRHRCAYCDFNTYAGMNDQIPAYSRALVREIEQVSSSAGEKLSVHTIFFGGGTPSLLPLEELGRIMASVRGNFDLAPGSEITLEANPGTLNLDYLHGLRQLGINRLSIGMQSANPEDLRLLERGHDFFTVSTAVAAARKAGFDNINLDLIFGIPYQSMQSWQRTLDHALGLGPDHFSLYSLIFEHGTPMNAWLERGLLQIPDGDLVADMYEYAIEYMEKLGFTQYEISNWARKDQNGETLACRHNLQYWLNQPYLGLGAGAHGFAGGVRTANARSPQAYIKRCMEGEPRKFPRTPAAVNVSKIDRDTEMNETMMMGLRLIEEGVKDARFIERFGVGIDDAFGAEVDELIGLGLLFWNGTSPNASLRLTERGKLMGNQVFMRFV